MLYDMACDLQARGTRIQVCFNPKRGPSCDLITRGLLSEVDGLELSGTRQNTSNRWSRQTLVSSQRAKRNMALGNQDKIFGIA